MRNTTLTRSNARSGFATSMLKKQRQLAFNIIYAPEVSRLNFPDSAASYTPSHGTIATTTIAAPCCPRRGLETTLLSAPQQTLALTPSVCATAHAAATVVPELE